MLVSECCGAPVYGEILDEGLDGSLDEASGLCSDCKEWMGVYDDEEEG